MSPILVEPVRIAGAGLSGLTTAIGLARQGRQVEVFETKANSGQSRVPDWDAVENWTTTQDFVALLDQWGLSRDFRHHPVREFVVCDHRGERYPISTARPLFYLVSRGTQAGSLEQALKRQALDCGVNIHYEQARSRQDVDVWAAGIRQRGFFLNAGLTFATSHADMVMAYVNAQTSPNAYAYLIIVNGRGRLSVLLTHQFPDARRLLHDTIATLRRTCWFEMDDVRYSSGFGGQPSALHRLSAAPIAVGEAAGFQDYLWGFGIRHALHSGHLAAQALDQGLDYRALIAAHIRPGVQASLVNRLLYDRAGNRTYRALIKYFSRSPDLTTLLRRWYAGSAALSLLWPIASALYRGTIS